MKKTIMTIALMAMVAMATITPAKAVSPANPLPKTSWQVWNPLTNLWLIYKTNNLEDGLCYKGTLLGFTGGCVQGDRATTPQQEARRIKWLEDLTK